MKYLKLLWLISLVSFAVYFITEWFESGFDSVLFASWIAILFSGVGFLQKNKFLYFMIYKLKNFGFSITCFAILFKLMSWQYADKLLIVGLSSLGIYFLIKVFTND